MPARPAGFGRRPSHHPSRHSLPTVPRPSLDHPPGSFLDALLRSLLDDHALVAAAVADTRGTREGE